MLTPRVDEASLQLINFAAIIEMAMRLITYIVFFLISASIMGQENLKTSVIGDTIGYLRQIRENPNNELIDLEDFVPGLNLDIRFAAKDNVTGEQLYSNSKAFARRPVAVSLSIIQEALNRRGLGLIIYDAYRPYADAKKLANRMKNSESDGFLENNIKHSRGASVDVSLISLTTGEEIQMPSGYCQNMEATQTDYSDLPDNVIANREILIQVMQQHGFRVSPKQWWHFDFMGWQAFDLMNLSFEELENVN